jgi:hypothetical protein
MSLDSTIVFMRFEVWGFRGGNENILRHSPEDYNHTTVFTRWVGGRSVPPPLSMFETLRSLWLQMRRFISKPQYYYVLRFKDKITDERQVFNRTGLITICSCYSTRKLSCSKEIELAIKDKQMKHNATAIKHSTYDKSLELEQNF